MRYIKAVEHHPDRDFHEIADAIVGEVLEGSGADELFLTEIKNWFDQKWLGFSGYGLVKNPCQLFLSSRNTIDACKAVFRQQGTTLPPFTPNRVLSQRHFKKISGEFAETNPRRVLHSTERRHSSANLQRRVRDLAGPAVFAWYSSNAEKNGVAALMVYISGADDVHRWFAEFRQNPDWRAYRADGITVDEVHMLMAVHQALRQA